MKKIFLGFAVFILALFISTGAGALSIDDSTLGATTYFGGIIHPSAGSYDDYIGSNFRVTNLTATQVGGYTTVVLTGPYFTTSYATGASSYGNIGDLYISSTGWKVNDIVDPVHFRNDTFLSSEGWNYVISYIDQKVYSLNNFAGITPTSNEGGEWGGSYRSDQAYRGGYSGSFLYDDVTVVLDSSSGILTFTFPDLGNVDAMGYHWTMACGNDVVEGGGTPVPEPATMLLVGSGLLGLAGYGRKKFFKK
jgi:hypothetical protein